jgi:hypothetical protein
MVSYFYAWTPLVILGAVIILALPWLGLIAFMIVSLVGLAALAALAWAILAVPYALGRAISSRWQVRSSAGRTTAAPVAGRAPRGVVRDL